MRKDINYSVVGSRILYIITVGTLGGAQVHVHDLVSCLPAQVEIHVVMGEKGWLWDKLQGKKVVLHQLPELVHPISIFNDFKALCALRHLINKVQPDLIHCHCSKAGFLGRLAAYLCSIPAIFTAHGWSFTDGISKYKKIGYLFLERLAVNWGQKIICVSNYDRELGLSALPKSQHKMITIHNGVRNISGLPTTPIGTRQSDAVKLIMIARFNQQKDQNLLIQALAVLTREKLPVIATFVGAGPNLDAAAQLAHQLEVDNSVVFLGNRDDIPQLLSEHDIFVLTSNWEGLPLSILEAMRQGLPVVASNVGGVKEAVFDQETGFLIPRGDLKYLVCRLRQLCLDYELRRKLGQEGNRIYKRLFTLETMTEKTIGVYNKFLKDVISL